MHAGKHPSGQKRIPSFTENAVIHRQTISMFPIQRIITLATNRIFRTVEKDRHTRSPRISGTSGHSSIFNIIFPGQSEKTEQLFWENIFTKHKIM